MCDDYSREMHEVVDVDGYLARQREASAASSPSSLLTLLLLEDVLFVGGKNTYYLHYSGGISVTVDVAVATTFA